MLQLTYNDDAKIEYVSHNVFQPDGYLAMIAKDSDSTTIYANFDPDDGCIIAASYKMVEYLKKLHNRFVNGTDEEAASIAWDIEDFFIKIGVEI